MSDRRSVAFIGAGQMGMPMVRRLIAAGHDVVVHARRPEARAESEAAGAAATSDAKAAVAGASVVIVCVFSDLELRDAALGPEGFLPAMDRGALLIVHTTGSPSTSKLLAEHGSALGLRVVEAPVSGSAADIEAGQVTVMLGGADGDVDDARPVVAAYGDPIFHLGPLGAAQAVKLLNNALFAANLQLVAEVERLAGELHIDWSQAAAVFQSSSGASRAMEIVRSMGSVKALVDAGGHFLVKDVSEVVSTAAKEGLDLGQLEAVNRFGSLRFLADGDSVAADQDLREIEAIKQLKARYFRFLDTKDWDAFADLFTADCEHLLPTEDPQPAVPNAQYLDDIRRTLADAITVHHGHMPEITITGPGEARGTWAMFDDIEIPRQGEASMHIRGYGHYHETYRKGEDGRWRISSKQNVRLRVDQVPPRSPAADPP